MELEKQVCSLELAKKLNELGVKQESFCYWIKQLICNKFEIKIDDYELSLLYHNNHIEEIYSAFTVAELGEMIKGWFIPFYHSINKWVWINIIEENTEADARARMLIYLIETKFIDVKEVNNGK